MCIPGRKKCVMSLFIKGLLQQSSVLTLLSLSLEKIRAIADNFNMGVFALVGAAEVVPYVTNYENNLRMGSIR